MTDHETIRTLANRKRLVCWQCFWRDVAGLPAGFAWGWWRAWRQARRSGDGVRIAWLYWRCWYWPLYTHLYHWDIPCVHDLKRQQPVNSAGGGE